MPAMPIRHGRQEIRNQSRFVATERGRVVPVDGLISWYFRNQAWGKRAGSTAATLHIPVSRRPNEAAIQRIGRIQRDLAPGGKDE